MFSVQVSVAFVPHGVDRHDRASAQYVTRGSPPGLRGDASPREKTGEGTRPTHSLLSVLKPETRNLAPHRAEERGSGVGLTRLSSAEITNVPVLDTDTREALEDFYQVILHNDDHNAMEHIVHCLMQVFGHNLQLAVKIMHEAHAKGSAIAEVEAESQARRHRDQLQSYGLSATIEKV